MKGEILKILSIKYKFFKSEFTIPLTKHKIMLIIRCKSIQLLLQISRTEHKIMLIILNSNYFQLALTKYHLYLFNYVRFKSREFWEHFENYVRLFLFGGDFRKQL